MDAPFTLVAIGQAGRLQYEALLMCASLQAKDPEFDGTLVIAEPQPGPLWPTDPRMDDDIRTALQDLGAQIVPFTSAHFGSHYPQGNKIEALSALPPDQPFLFLDSDTLILGPLSQVPFDFDRPTASMRRTNTWPEIQLYGPGYAATWRSLYDRFDLDFESSLDTRWPDEYWQRYLYFNAGWFLGRDPVAFGKLFTKFARSIRDDPPPELVCQSLDPWLDQVTLPLVIHALGGGRPGAELDGLDGDVTCHWRVMPLAYAREPDQVIDVLEEVSAPNRLKKRLKQHEPFRRMIYQRRGHKARALFDRSHLPRKEQAIRNRLKSQNLWMR